MEDYKKYLSEGPQTALENRMIDEYLKGKGYTRSDVQRMPKKERQALMREACLYASLKLAEIDSRVKFRQAIKAPK